MTRYVDLAYAQDDEGVFDLVIDEDMADFDTTDGLESAIVVSLFSDRRAYRDEVGDPMKRGDGLAISSQMFRAICMGPGFGSMSNPG